eukprot:s90_g57.t1
MSGGFNDLSTTSRYEAGDVQVQRAVQLRTAAAVAYITEQTVTRPCGTLYMLDIEHGTTTKLVKRCRIVKASPEHLRPIAEEEKFILTDWMQDILETKKKLKENEYKGYIDFVGPLPPQAPRHRVTGKRSEDTIEFKPDASMEKRRRLQEGARHDEPVAQSPRSVSMAPTTPARTEDLEAEDFRQDPLPELDETGGREQVPEEETETPRPLEEESAPEEPRPERGQVREGEPLPGEDRPTKRHRTELLEMLFTQLEQTMLSRKRKEITYRTMSKKDQKKFDKAILKEINNNLKSGAYKALSREESEKIRREKPDLVMKSLLLDNEEGEILKAKARHVMKGYSEANAEDLESTTPQVAKESVFFVLQILASMGWNIGHLDFTQAFHSGDGIDRELYCSLPPEGVPGLHERQLLKLLKTCYGLTDGPYQWYQHVSKVLESRGYVKSKADPCLFILYNDKNNGIDGIIALATDDMVHGGTERHWEQMEWLRNQYKMGKYTTGGGKFTGKMIEPAADGSIMVHQQPYTEEKVHTIPLERSRKRMRYSKCNPQEINQLRTLLGSLSWVAKETRPDVAGRVALLQQAMPTPMIKDIVEANQVAEELKKTSTLGIKIQPIPMERLRIGVITDASWGNSGDQYLEESKKDYWEETPTSWIRHHVLPRRLLFHPGAAPEGPDLHTISRTRTTRTSDEIYEDPWDDREAIREYQTTPWTGTTTFLKSQVEEEVSRPINERFLQLARKHSQGGYLLVYYDSTLEVSEQLEMMTIAAWKSYKLKRCTVNTLSAECQSMIQGIGNLHWHRFLLTEVAGGCLHLDSWEQELKKIPFIAVTDSKSLYDTVTKCRNTSAHIDDKRTAIDLTILKNDLQTTQGQVRWVSGTNMVSDSLTKKMSSAFLQKVMRLGRWSLTESGHHRLAEIHALFNIKRGACEV